MVKIYIFCPKDNIEHWAGNIDNIQGVGKEKVKVGLFKSIASSPSLWLLQMVFKESWQVILPQFYLQINKSAEQIKIHIFLLWILPFYTVYLVNSDVFSMLEFTRKICLRYLSKQGLYIIHFQKWMYFVCTKLQIFKDILSLILIVTVKVNHFLKYVCFKTCLFFFITYVSYYVPYPLCQSIFGGSTCPQHVIWLQ